jgi:hypothetical protein
LERVDNLHTLTPNYIQKGIWDIILDH